MKKAYHLLFIAFISLQLPIRAVSQEVLKISEPLIINESSVEELYEKTDDNEDYSDILDQLLQFSNHPLDINNASEADLKQLQLNDLQVYNLKAYMEQYGQLVGIHELNLVEGFDSILVSRLEPFIEFNFDPLLHEMTFKNLVMKGKHQVLTRYQWVVQQQKGYLDLDDSLLVLNPNSIYAGDRGKMLIKYGYNFYNRLRFGVLMEKDAGETLFPISDTIKKGFDFYSLHLFYKGKGFLKNLALGDYHLQFGQGLTMFSSFAYSKTPSSTLLGRKVYQLKPSTGANETRFFSGAAATISPLDDLDITLFYSSKQIDGNRLDADTSGNVMISSLQQTGLHRTKSEIDDRHVIGQQVFGANVQAGYRMFKMGATAFKTRLTGDLQKPLLPYNQFDFRGNSLFNYGFDFSSFYRSLSIFGEVSGSGNGAKAMLIGSNYQPDSRYGLSLLYRNYSRDYQNLFSNAFGEGSVNANEKGLYLGLYAHISARFMISAYADHYKFDWLKYRVNAPSIGKEYMGQLTYTPAKGTEILLRYRYHQKQLNPSGNTSFIDYPSTLSRNNYRIHIVVRPNHYLTLKSRVDYVVNIVPDEQGSNNGFLLYQDVIINNPKLPWFINLRYALFDTDTYEERLYAYESDVLYSFSVPAYYYKGSRFYIMGKYSLNRDIDMWVRFAQSYYSNGDTIGTGLEEIKGNVKSEVKFQILLKL